VHGQGFRFVGSVQEHSAPEIPVLLVAPFTSLTDADRDFFADGLSEDLITDLAAVNGLRVISRNDAFAIRRRDQPAASFAAQLRASHYLTGSVRRAGGQIRLNAELNTLDEAASLWAGGFSGEADDIFALQDQITVQIVAALKLHLTPVTTQRRPPGRVLQGL